MTKSTKIKISNDLKSFNELTEKAVSHMETFIASEGGRLSASTGELYDVIPRFNGFDQIVPVIVRGRGIHHRTIDSGDLHRREFKRLRDLLIPDNPLDTSKGRPRKKIIL